jgi:hypothetical protein
MVGLKDSQLFSKKVIYLQLAKIPKLIRLYFCGAKNTCKPALQFQKAFPV